MWTFQRRTSTEVVCTMFPQNTGKVKPKWTASNQKLYTRKLIDGAQYKNIYIEHKPSEVNGKKDIIAGIGKTWKQTTETVLILKSLQTDQIKETVQKLPDFSYKQYHDIHRQSGCLNYSLKLCWTYRDMILLRNWLEMR